MENSSHSNELAIQPIATVLAVGLPMWPSPQPEWLADAAPGTPSAPTAESPRTAQPRWRGWPGLADGQGVLGKVVQAPLGQRQHA
jgi:hypothetical protein